MTISKPILFHHMGDATYVNRRLELLLKVGCKLMESAADTPRIMRNMKRTAAFLNLKDECLQVYVNYNLLMVNYSDDEHSYTKFQRCTKHGIDMTAISRISRLSWTAIKDDYTLDEFEKLSMIFVPHLATTLHGRLPLAVVLPAVDSAYSSGATGLHSSMLR